MLLTGDIPSEVEGEIYADIKNRYTVLKVAHHGSKNSSCENFLAKVNPRYSIISVGEHNLYGHPADETIQRLENQNTTIYRTDQVGAVEIKSDGEHIEISGWK
jgi:competence protein ComEC